MTKIVKKKDFVFACSRKIQDEVSMKQLLGLESECMLKVCSRVFACVRKYEKLKLRRYGCKTDYIIRQSD